MSSNQMWAGFAGSCQYITNVLSMFAGITSKYLLIERRYYSINWYKPICIISKQLESRLSELFSLVASSFTNISKRNLSVAVYKVLS